MKRVTILLLLLVAATMWAQDKSIVTVKSGELNNGVIILTVHQASPVTQGKASFVLQCNKGLSDCAIPKPGNYLMVRLPEKWGMYDCANVDLYPAAADPQTSQKIGEYCLIDR